MDQALAAYQRAEQWNPDLPPSPYIENKLCSFGSLRNRVKDVLHHCDRAVAGAPGNGRFTHSRGIARALIGNLQGAAEDFRAYLEWASDQVGITERMLARRSQWLQALESGRNPFDTSTLESLRRNEI